jgi:hypothetical protein
MKKYILAIVTLISLSVTNNASFAQVYTTQHDTAAATVSTSANIDNKITVTATTPRKIKWAPTATNFPTDWQDGAVLGICDNNGCISNNSNTLFTHIFVSDEYMPGVAGDFHMAINLVPTTSLGTYYLTVNLKDDSLNLQSKNIVFVVTHNTTGISTVNMANEKQLFVSPNPATDHTQLYFNITKDQNIEVAISDALGKEVVHSNYTITTHNPTVNINTGAFATGIYYVKVKTDNGILTERLSIAK